MKKSECKVHELTLTLNNQGKIAQAENNETGKDEIRTWYPSLNWDIRFGQQMVIRIIILIFTLMLHSLSLSLDFCSYLLHIL